jgi:putative LysE/RhtB family amino acid efflux pump
MIIIFLTGILIGLAVAAPIGPVGLLCMRKTLEFGLMGTVAVAVGTALADAIYASIAAFGLTAVSELLLKQATYFKIVGGLLLFGLALKEYYSKNPIIENAKVSKKSFFSLIMTTFFLTLCNPIGIVSFIALFAMLGENLLSMNNASLMVLGVFVGSVAWFLILGRVISRTQHLLPEHFVRSVRKISAIILAAFGAFAFLSL